MVPCVTMGFIVLSVSSTGLPDPKGRNQVLFVFVFPAPDTALDDPELLSFLSLSTAEMAGTFKIDHNPLLSAKPAHLTANWPFPPQMQLTES